MRSFLRKQRGKSCRAKEALRKLGLRIRTFMRQHKAKKRRKQIRFWRWGKAF